MSCEKADLGKWLCILSFQCSIGRPNTQIRVPESYLFLQPASHVETLTPLNLGPLDGTPRSSVIAAPSKSKSTKQPEPNASAGSQSQTGFSP